MRKTSGAVGVLLAITALHGCARGELSDDRPGGGDPGRLVIVGGALQADNGAVYKAIVEGREGNGPLCVVPTASGQPEQSMSSAVETLAAYAGAGAVKGVLISTEDPSRATDPAVAAELARCSGFFFTGGSQSRIADVFLPGGDTTEAYRALRHRWEEGAIVAGTSAGAAMMSRIMISGGSSAEAVNDGVAAERGGDGVDLRPGMGFFEPIVDQHFLARGRIGRLLVAVAAQESPGVGFGIDENTALVVDGDSALVLGASGVVTVDGRSADRTGPHHPSGLIVQLAGSGDVIDLRTAEVRRGSGKVAVPVTGAALDPPDDPFARWAFLHLVVDLVSSEDQEVTLTLPDATLRIAKDEGYSASMAEPVDGVEGTPSGLSAGPFEVDLTPRAREGTGGTGASEGRRIALVRMPYTGARNVAELSDNPDYLFRHGIADTIGAMGFELAPSVSVALTDEDEKEYGPWHRMGLANGHLADIVARNRREGTLTVGLLGNCTSVIGVLGGLQHSGEDGRPQRVALVFIDAHGDFNVPETTLSGMLGGMPVAVSAGMALHNLRRESGLDPGIPTGSIVMGAVRDLDPLERELIEESDIQHLTTEDLVSRPDRVRAQIERLAGENDLIYVHVDMDVLDPREVPGHPLTVPNGPTSVELGSALAVMFEHPAVTALGIASTPANERDPEGASLAAAYNLIKGALEGVAARQAGAS